MAGVGPLWWNSGDESTGLCGSAGVGALDGGGGGIGRTAGAVGECRLVGLSWGMQRVA